MMTKVNNKPTCRGHSMETRNTKKKRTNKTKAAQGETKSKNNVLTDSKRQLRPVVALK